MLHDAKETEIINPEISKIDGVLSLSHVKTVLKAKRQVKMRVVHLKILAFSLFIAVFSHFNRN
jgi:hypothetical protein